MNVFRLLIAAALLPLACLSIVRSDAPSVAPAGAAPAEAVPAAETATAGSWHWPLPPPHPVLRGFQAPATLYAPGHRGLDLSAEAGREVVAPAEGVVSFAGLVVDRPVLSIQHADGLVSSLEPVSADVAVGDRVTAGQLVGAVADGGHCAGRCLHLGARLNGGYVSPLLYLVGVPRAVLLPALHSSGR
ncbi:MAG TPA: M23 family metallopeptidase [Cryobacterium sp.]|nr:M23 family metallopeptidase [Cryobacterium sp.]